MALEIERKFLVERIPPDVEIGSELDIAQGYLATGGEQVRLRRQDDATLLTAKRGHGIVRDEVEVPLDGEAFDALWPLTQGRRLEKTRKTTNVEGATIEIDVYKGQLAGLIVAEVEFEDTDSAHAFTPPPWFSRELSGDGRYSNQRLAVEGLPPDDGA
jgi:adenylate cyclase